MKNLKYLYCLFALFCLVSTKYLVYSHSCTKTYYYEIQDKRHMDGAQNPNFGKKHHVLGTCHLLPLKELPSPIIRNIKKHNFLINESDGTTISNLENDYNYKVFKKLFPSNSSCSYGYFNQLNSSQKKEFKRVVNKKILTIGVNVKKDNTVIRLHNFLPPALFNLYTFGLQSRGMDRSIQSKFSQNSISLDSLASGIDYVNPTDFGSTSHRLAIKNLKKEINNSLIKKKNPIVQDYISGVMEKKYFSNSSLNYSLVKGRNLAWMPFILDQLRNKHSMNNISTNKVLIAVETMHIFGKYGILNQLQQEGFHIKRAQNNEKFYSLNQEEKFQIKK